MIIIYNIKSISFINFRLRLRIVRNFVADPGPVMALATSEILLQDHATALATSWILLQDHVTAPLATSLILLQGHVTALATFLILLQHHGPLQRPRSCYRTT